ncbi:hypothetical protein HDEF_1571 [Candidatus Hamiltonella defensa 5AT (Acyrthosiphon pisum)]|uniref:Uncharacterized protein n=1 Tax=Hamiltonella defensa subsp. Acyrthosiphon pisum (strain 5AT) TaxID=572265 RepID=C4K6J3_HAMD5|nr:hypothetical protein HDEF_1571 [Candidatus Hamiltonella defensa 5AT (Acyrthosiphon pisum)]
MTEVRITLKQNDVMSLASIEVLTIINVIGRKKAPLNVNA